MDTYFSFEKLIFLKNYYPFIISSLLILYLLVYNYSFGFKMFEIISIIGICILFSARYVPSYFISDTSRYIQVFNEIDSFSSIFNNSMSWKNDHLFFMIGYCAKLISSNYHFLLFVFLITSVSVTYYTLKNGNFIVYKRASILFLFLIFSSPFFVSLNTNLLRQGIVVSLSFYFFYKHKNCQIKLLDFLILLLPLLIHKSYLIFIILFYLNRILKFKQIALLVAPIYLFKNFILTRIQTPILNEVIQISSRIETYNTHDIGSIDFFISKLIFYIVISLILYGFAKKYHCIQYDLKFVFLVIIFSIMFVEFPIISKRLLYFIPLILIKSFHDLVILNRIFKSVIFPLSCLIIGQAIIVSIFSKSIADIAFKLF